MTNSFTVRAATDKDVHELYLLNKEFNGITMAEQRILDSLQNSQEIIAVAEQGKSITGFGCAQRFNSFCYESSWGEITELYIRSEFRRQGIATLIISFLEETLCKRGVKTVKILTGQTNTPAIRTYSSLGYVQENEVFLLKTLM